MEHVGGRRFSVGELHAASKTSSSNGSHLNWWDFDISAAEFPQQKKLASLVWIDPEGLFTPKTHAFSVAEILLRIYQNPIHLNGTRWRTTFWRQREVRRRKTRWTARPNCMLDLIPAQQPIKNQHQILWCGYQHVITSRPITALVFMRRPAFFCFRCECSSTDKTRRKRRAFLVWIGPYSGGLDIHGETGGDDWSRLPLSTCFRGVTVHRECCVSLGYRDE